MGYLKQYSGKYFSLHALQQFGVVVTFLCGSIDLLTPWSSVLLEKLTGSQRVKKFPAFYGTRMFITAFTSVRHLSL
jgi:hypothetical protein